MLGNFSWFGSEVSWFWRWLEHTFCGGRVGDGDLDDLDDDDNVDNGGVEADILGEEAEGDAAAPLITFLHTVTE